MLNYIAHLLRTSVFNITLLSADIEMCSLLHHAYDPSDLSFSSLNWKCKQNQLSIDKHDLNKCY